MTRWLNVFVLAATVTFVLGCEPAAETTDEPIVVAPEGSSGTGGGADIPLEGENVNSDGEDIMDDDETIVVPADDAPVDDAAPADETPADDAAPADAPADVDVEETTPEN